MGSGTFLGLQLFTPFKIKELAQDRPRSHFLVVRSSSRGLL
jgi:hypothetical protein